MNEAVIQEEEREENEGEEDEEYNEEDDEDVDEEKIYILKNRNGIVLFRIAS